MAGRKRKTQKISEETQLEDSFDSYWIQLGDGTKVIRQHRGIFSHVNKKGRSIMTRHSFDFAFPVERVAVEIQGGIFSKGRHVRAKGYHNDRAKMRLAMRQGWLVLEYTTLDVKNDPVSMIEEINDFLVMRRVVQKQPIQLFSPIGERSIS